MLVANWTSSTSMPVSSQADLAMVSLDRSGGHAHGAKSS